MLAAGAGCTPIVDCLLDAGADPSATNDFGASALAYAALEGHLPHTPKVVNSRRVGGRPPAWGFPRAIRSLRKLST